MCVRDMKDPRSLLSRYGADAKKYYSQNFLVSEKVVNTMSSFACGTVLEIGPGVGTLTDALSKKADRVIAIEKDPQMVEILTNEYSWDNVKVICADALETQIPPYDVCISSVPYAISSPLVFRLLETDFTSLVLLLQKEFAEKLIGASKPSRLTMMATAQTSGTRVMSVRPQAFFPRPKVDSWVVRLVPEKKVDVDTFYYMTATALFTHKRKTVRNALVDAREIFNKDKKEMRALVEDIPYPDMRCVTLDIYKIREIATFLSDKT